MDPFVIVIVLGTLAVVVGLVLLGSHLERKRREAVAAFAEGNGFVVDADVGGFQAAMGSFKLFSRGRARQVKNLIRAARDDREVAICDYQYTTGSGKNSHTHRQTVCVVQAPGTDLGHFFVRRQVAVFDFLGKLFGGQDINFEDDPEFSRTYVLQGLSGEDDLRRRFGEHSRQALVGLAGKRIQVEGLGDRLLLHYGTRLGTDRFRELVDDALAVRRLFG